jgi:hypothetical protein
MAEAIELNRSSGSRFYTEILENPLKVLFDRARTDRENGSNVFIALPGSQPLEHFSFSFCQTVHAWRDRCWTLIEEKEQPFIVFDQAHMETCALSSADQDLLAQAAG